MDVALALDKLVPSAQYGGSLTANTREAYEALRWEDTRKKPGWDDLLAAGPVAPAKPLNEQLEDAFLAFLPKHIGQPYLTNDLMIQIGTLKQIVTDYNRLGLYALSKLMIGGIIIPEAMEADRKALIALYPEA